MEADGVATFTASLVHALAQNAPPLAKLAAGDGTLAVPFHAKGAVNDFAVELAPSFTAALEKARLGWRTGDSGRAVMQVQRAAKAGYESTFSRPLRGRGPKSRGQ